MDDGLKSAIQTALINIGNTEEGKAVISIYSHNGYEQYTICGLPPATWQRE